MKDLQHLDKFQQPTSNADRKVYFIPSPKNNGDWFWVEIGTHTDVGPIPDWEWLKVELWTIVSRSTRKSKPRDRFLTGIEVEYVRELFFADTEIVGQFHPCALDLTFSIHLWRRLDGAPWYPTELDSKLVAEPAPTVATDQPADGSV